MPAMHHLYLDAVSVSFQVSSRLQVELHDGRTKRLRDHGKKALAPGVNIQAHGKVAIKIRALEARLPASQKCVEQVRNHVALYCNQDPLERDHGL